MTECPFTDRELECVVWLSKGKTADETGSILGISRHTVAGYLNTARIKTGTTKATGLLMIAERSGWLK